MVTALTTPAKVRIQLMTTDTTILTDAFLNQLIADAADEVQTQQGISDETAERYYTCYLVLLSQQTQYVLSENGVRFSEIDPEGYLKLYKVRTRRKRGLGLQKANSAKDDATDLNT